MTERGRGGDPRLQRSQMATLRSWGPAPNTPESRGMKTDVVFECGWGRMIFAHTFENNAAVAECLRHEKDGRRDIAFYLRDPHVVLSLAPQELFLDPSHTYRLWLDRYRTSRVRPRGFVIRKAETEADVAAVNRIYAVHRMAPSDPDFVVSHRNSRRIIHFVAVDARGGEVIGTVTGLDHKRIFDDPENGSSLWCLAVDPQARHPGVGEALVRHLAEHYLARGRAFMDLSVMHDNDNAIQLYDKLQFERVPVFCVKRRNPFNERLFAGPQPEAALNPYAMIIINEARRRGIAVEILDEEAAYFSLTFGGRSVICRESLSELTSAVAMSRCDDKGVTWRLLRRKGLSLPEQMEAGDEEAERAFLDKHGRIVVKPAHGEQGRGVFVDLRDEEEMRRAVDAASRLSEKVLLEQYATGEDLRIVVIDFRTVAAAVRRPPQIVGDGRRTAEELIEKQSRRRAAATRGESRIPLDDETRRCVRSEGLDMDSVLDEGRMLTVRKTANLHTGGTIHDVTDRLHPALREAAEEGARALDIPVVGFDFIVPSVEGPDYVVIEANERPGLANHEPAPTAERFIDLLFPQTAAQTAR